MLFPVALRVLDQFPPVSQLNNASNIKLNMQSNQNYSTQAMPEPIMSGRMSFEADSMCQDVTAFDPTDLGLDFEPWTNVSDSVPGNSGQ